MGEAIGAFAVFLVGALVVRFFLAEDKRRASSATPQEPQAPAWGPQPDEGSPRREEAIRSLRSNLHKARSNVDPEIAAKVVRTMMRQDAPPPGRRAGTPRRPPPAAAGGTGSPAERKRDSSAGQGADASLQ